MRSGLYHSAVSVIESGQLQVHLPFNGLSLRPAVTTSKNKDGRKPQKHAGYIRHVFSLILSLCLLRKLRLFLDIRII